MVFLVVGQDLYLAGCIYGEGRKKKKIVFDTRSSDKTDALWEPRALSNLGQKNKKEKGRKKMAENRGTK